ncbi:MAG: hypothetical protein WBL20_16175 [Sphingobium sp.]
MATPIFGLCRAREMMPLCFQGVSQLQDMSGALTVYFTVVKLQLSEFMG